MPQSTFLIQENLRKNYRTNGSITEDKKSYRAIIIEDHRPDEVFIFFRNLENLPFFIKGLKSISILSPVLSHWEVQLKSGAKAQCDVAIIEEIPNVMLSWQSVTNAQITSSGSVWFRKGPSGAGTIVKLSMDFDLPGGKIAELSALLTGEDLDSLATTNLHRLKAFLETGEIPTIEGQSSGREALTHESLKH